MISSVRKRYLEAVEKCQLRDAARKQKTERYSQLHLFVGPLPASKQWLRKERTRERNAAILELCRDSATSLQEIGQRFGVSRQLVIKIRDRAGLPHRKRGPRYGNVSARVGSQNPIRDAEVRKMRDSGMTLRAIGKQLGLSCERIRQIIKRTGSTYHRAGAGVKTTLL